MSKAMRTVLMYLFGKACLMPEDYNDEYPINWKQFKVAVATIQVSPH